MSRLKRRFCCDQQRSAPCGRKHSEMRNWFRMTTLAEHGFRPFDKRMNRPEPNAWRSTTLAAEKGAHVGQDGIAHVEQYLKWLESKYGEGETPGKPFGVGQTPENLRNGFSAELHRAIGHEQMDRLVGIPDVELRMERQQRIWVVANRLYDEACLGRTTLCRLL